MQHNAHLLGAPDCEVSHEYYASTIQSIQSCFMRFTTQSVLICTSMFRNRELRFSCSRTES